jgi:hypothetical protein
VTVDNEFGGGSKQASEVENNAIAVSTSQATTTTLGSSLNPSTFGASVTFTATVSPTPTGGSVTFIEGGTCGTPLATLAGPTAVVGGQAAFSSSTLSLGSHTIIACYGGTTGFLASSGSVTQVVNQATSTTTVVCPASQQYIGSAIEPCTASYTTSDGLNGTLTVSYTNNVNVGTANASATYPGDANHSSSSDSETFEITKATRPRRSRARQASSTPVRRSSRARRRIRPPMVSMAA